MLGALASHAFVSPGTGDTSLPDSGLDTGAPPLDTDDTDVPPPVDTDDTDDPTDTDGTPTEDPDDTGVFCVDCLTASELASEQGGGPCEEGCSSASVGASTVLTLLGAVVLLLRRTR